MDRVRRLRTIVVNRSWELAPWADHLYIADRRALALWMPQARAGGFTGVIWHPRPYTQRGVIPLSMSHDQGLDKRQGFVSCGGTGGYQAVNLAYHLGATRIILLGYDYQYTNGQTHWHGDHPNGWANMGSAEERGKLFAKLAEDLEAEGVELINCTHETSLPVRRAKLEDVV